MADTIDVDLLAALIKYLDARDYLWRARERECECENIAAAKMFRARGAECRQLQQYLETVRQTVERDADSADPVETLAEFTARCERSAGPRKQFRPGGS